MKMFTIYKYPLDYPDKFVVRCWYPDPASLKYEKEPTAVVDTLDQARQAIPLGLTNIGRFEDDDPKILEVWM